MYNYAGATALQATLETSRTMNPPLFFTFACLLLMGNVFPDAPDRSAIEMLWDAKYDAKATAAKIAAINAFAAAGVAALSNSAICIGYNVSATREFHEAVRRYNISVVLQTF
jgi:hypothetical protein